MKKSISHYVLFAISLMGIGIIASCKKENTSPVTNTKTTDSLKVGLLAWYTFNNTGADSSGNGNDGSLYNIASTTDRNGKANYAYYFDGATSYISVNDNQALRLNNTDITLNTWVKLDFNSTLTSCAMLTKRITGPDNGWTFGVAGIGVASTPGFVTYGPGSTSLLATGTNLVTFGQWHMLTCVYNLSAKQLTIYVDGKLNTVTANMASPNATISALLYIGKDNPNVVSSGYYFKGSLDDLRIYRRALSITEIQKLMAVTL